jgi:hypothetical protein
MTPRDLETAFERIEVLEKRDRRRSLQLRLNELRAAGYDGSLHNPDDAAEVHTASCELCEQKGLKYIGLVALKPVWSYVAIAECRRCGWWEEV